MNDYSLAKLNKKLSALDQNKSNNDLPKNINNSSESYLSILSARNNLRGGNVLGNDRTSLNSALNKYYNNSEHANTNEFKQSTSNNSENESVHSFMKSILSKLTGVLSESGDAAKNTANVLAGTLQSAHSSFVSQLKGVSNKNENADLNNNNCGPACLLMIARACGVIDGNSSNANEQIEYMRELMGASKDEMSLTFTDQIVTGARALGINAEVDDGGMNNLVNHLKNGKQAILNVRNGGGHAVTVTGMQGDKFIVQDPLKNKPELVSAEQLNNAWGQSSGLMVVLG